MNFEGIILSEISQSQTKNYCTIQWIGHIWSSENHKDKNQTVDLQGQKEQNGELLFNVPGILVLPGEKDSFCGCSDDCT